MTVQGLGMKCRIEGRMNSHLYQDILEHKFIYKVKPSMTTRFSCCAKMAIERNMGRNFVA